MKFGLITFIEKIIRKGKSMIEIVKELKEANCVTHGGKFHSDEIFATVILSKILTRLE